MIKLLDAIFAIDPKAEVTFHEEDIDSLKWDSTPISKDVILAKKAEMQTEYDNKKYQRDRKPMYGTWEEQLDMMYHGTWKDHVDKIKSDIPKG
jgi:hypothetical protein